MKILTGTVAMPPDIRGVFYVTTADVGSPYESIPVNYTSPYGGSPTHGIVAMPEEHDEVLIVQPTNSSEWFYLNTIWRVPKIAALSEGGFEDGPTADNLDAPRKGHIFPDALMFKAAGVPDRYVWKSPLGNKITLSDSRNKDFENIQLRLRSPRGKILTLNDSDHIDSIILRNEHGDYIKISTKGHKGRGEAARMIEAECLGPARTTSHEGSIDLRVVDGKEINIANTSTGSHKNPDEVRIGGTNNAGGPHLQALEQLKSGDAWGNINIYSQYNDVNIDVRAPDGNINITSHGDEGTINVTSEGEGSNIRVRSEGTMQLTSRNKLTIASDTSDVDIDAGGNILATAEGNVDIDGTRIDLN